MSLSDLVEKSQSIHADCHAVLSWLPPSRENLGRRLALMRRASVAMLAQRLARAAIGTKQRRLGVRTDE